jgi:hypothetical protein
MDRFESVKRTLAIAGFSLAVILVLYNLYTGAFIHKISIPGIFEIEFDSTQNDLKAKNTPSTAGLDQPSAVNPDQFIRDYYTAINNRQYDQTWSMLSDNFKRTKNPTGIGDYIKFWDSIARIEIESVVVQDQAADAAVILTAVTYTKRDGGTSRSNYTFRLMRAQSPAGWLIDWQE